MNAIILAGGKSSRMGFDKAFLEIEGELIIKRQIKLLREIFSRQAILNKGGIPPPAGKKIIVVTNSPHKYNKLRNIRIVTDIIPECGPLGGIYSGLLASDSFYNFIVACDMPFLNSGLIRYMYKVKKDYDVIIPKINNKYDPLFCIYSKNCIKHIRRLLDKKKFKIRAFFKNVKVRKIREEEVQRFGIPSILFANINTPLDYIKFSNS